MDISGFLAALPLMIQHYVRLAVKRALPPRPKGRIILLVGVYTMYTGWFGYYKPEEQPPSKARALEWFDQVSKYIGPGSDIIGIVMLVVGALGIFYSYCRRGREIYALTGLRAFALAWGLTFLISLVLTRASYNDVSGPVGVWLILVFGVLTITQRLGGEDDDL